MLHWKRVLPWTAVGLTVCAFARLAGTLTVNGNTVATDFLVKNGRTYVPLADVAKALNMAVSSTDGGFTLSPAGGANQVNGLNGAIGQLLSSGDFTLKVTDLTVGDKFSCKNSTDVWAPAKDGDNLVVVTMTVKNATKIPQMVIVRGGDNTALTDSNSHGYSVLDYDGNGGRSPSVLPGAAIDFSLKFSVPKTETPNDLVYNLYTYGTDYKSHQFRISLKKPN